MAQVPTADQGPRPVFMKAWNRKCGRYEVEQFGHKSSSPACVGARDIGKVKVDCRFHFTRSKWGVLGEAENPAGIIYLDLNFDQPKGCKLKDATVLVTLDSSDVGLESVSTAELYRISELPVQITDWYGPKRLNGPPKTVLTTKTAHFTPEVNVLGNGAGGVGMDKQTSFVYASRWQFSGQLIPSEGRTWHYKTLKWELTENDLESQPLHSNVVHTAFAFEHAGQPFLMKVEIKGRLESLRDRVKSKFGPRKPEDVSTTLINFGQHSNYTRRLDELARNLQLQMELENYQAIPAEVPDPQGVTFHRTMSSHGPVPSQDGIYRSQPSASGMMPALPSRNLQRLAPGPNARLLGEGLASTSGDRTEPTLENLARVRLAFTSPAPLIRDDSSDDDDDDTSETSSGEWEGSTLAERQESEGKSSEDRDAGETRSDTKALGVKRQPTLPWLQTGWLMLLQFVWMFGLFGRKGPSVPRSQKLASASGRNGNNSRRADACAKCRKK